MLTFISLGSVGVFEAVNKFLPYYRAYEKPNKNDLFSKTILYGASGITISLIIAFFLKNHFLNTFDRSGILEQYLYLLPIFIFGFFTFNLFQAFCVGFNFIVLTSFVKDIFVRLYNTLVVGLYIFNFISFDHIIILLSLQFWLAALIYLFHLNRHKLLTFTFQTSIVTKRLSKKIISYISYFWLATFFAALGTVVDKFALLSIKGYEQVAYFTIAEYLITFILVPQKAIQTTMTPLISDSWRRNDKTHIKELYQRGAQNITWAGGLLYITMLVSINEIFALFPINYGVGKEVFIILGIAKMIDFSTSINAQIMLYSKRYYKIEMMFSIALNLILLPVTYLLVTKFGILGTAYAHLICYSTINFIRLIFLKRKESISPLEGNGKLFIFLAVLIVAAISFTYSEEINYNYSYLQLIFIICLKSILILSFILFVIFKFKLSEDLIAFTKKTIQNFKLRL